MKSIKLYLVIAILSTITILSFLAALQGYRSSVSTADKLFDNQLRDMAVLLDSVRIDNLPENHNIDRLVFQFWSGDRSTLQISNGEPEPISLFEEGFAYNNFSGYRWRTFALYNEELSRWVFVAERADIRFVLADVIAMESIFPIVLSLPVAAIIIWIIVTMGLSLLTRLAGELADKKAEDLSPVVYKQVPRELEPVIQSINSLFNKLQDAFDREKRFASDAAHELRTPIAALKLHLHNLKNELTENTSKIDEVNADVLRLEHVVEQILALYQTTPAHFQSHMEVVDLFKIAQQAIIKIYDKFENKSQTIELSGEKSFISGNEAALNILLLNLLSNANKYCPVESTVNVVVEQSDGQVVLKVIDDGPGIQSADYQRVFDRFYRSGGDRHASKELGCGLGLSIVKHIIQLHNGDIHLTAPDNGTGLIVTIIFAAVTAIESS